MSHFPLVAQATPNKVYQFTTANRSHKGIGKSWQTSTPSCISDDTFTNFLENPPGSFGSFNGCTQRCKALGCVQALHHVVLGWEIWRRIRLTFAIWIHPERLENHPGSLQFISPNLELPWSKYAGYVSNTPAPSTRVPVAITDLNLLALQLLKIQEYRMMTTDCCSWHLHACCNLLQPKLGMNDVLKGLLVESQWDCGTLISWWLKTWKALNRYQKSTTKILIRQR